MPSFKSLFQTDAEVIPDDQDETLAKEYLKKWDEYLSPRVGDYIIMPDGTYERFSHDWIDSLQTSPGGSFHLGDGFTSFSGALNPSIPIEDIHPIDFKMCGNFWMWHHGFPGYHNAVGVTALCRVFVHKNYQGRPIRPGRW